MAWLFLLAAGLVEVAFALSIEPTDGFTRPLQTALCFVLGASSIYLLTHALETLPIGTAYAIFTGIGAIGTVVLGIVLAGDPGQARPDRADRGGDRRPQAVLGGLTYAAGQRTREGRPRRLFTSTTPTTLGAVLVGEDGKILAEGRNTVNSERDRSRRDHTPINIFNVATATIVGALRLFRSGVLHHENEGD